MADKTPEELEADRLAAEEQARLDAEAAELERINAPDPETPAVDRLRAFEDAEFGKDAVRIGGKIERGYGSPFKAMSAEKQRQYAAIEKLVESEQKLADAHAALIAADVEHDAALAAAEPKPDAAPSE